jgi:hypothetical protein
MGGPPVEPPKPAAVVPEPYFEHEVDQAAMALGADPNHNIQGWFGCTAMTARDRFFHFLEDKARHGLEGPDSVTGRLYVEYSALPTPVGLCVVHFKRVSTFYTFKH